MDPLSSASATSSTTNTSSSQSASAIASDFDTFLKMLTTQLENQDPLDPVDSQELAVQLATFSGVEQQTQTNALLEELGDQMGLMSLSQLASWVGMDALSPGPVYFDGTPVEIRPNTPALADEAELVVYRQDGTEVQRVAISVTDDVLIWDGIGADGNPLPEGTYSLVVESSTNGEALPPEAVDAYREVIEVQATDGVTTLVTTGGLEVPAASVASLRPTT